MTTELLHVFVYGTLKPGERYHDRYCGGKVIEAREAIVYGQLFDFPDLGYPGMTEGSSPIYGVVLTFADLEVLNSLDELEGYEPQRPIWQNEYIRVQTETFSLEHQPLTLAWVYLMQIEQAKRMGGVWLPNGQWTGSKGNAFDR